MEPVTAAPFMQQGAQYAQQYAQQGLQYAKNGLQSAGGGIWNFIKGVIAAPFNALSGLASGAFSGLVNYGLLGGAALTGVCLFLPDLIRPVTELIGKGEWATKLGNLASTGGFPAVAATCFAIAGGASAAVGGLTGMVGGMRSGFQDAREESPEPSGGLGIGTVVGGGLALAAVSFVALGALKKHDIIGGDSPADATPTPPPATPIAVRQSQPTLRA
jgi:hypothetical protein